MNDKNDKQEIEIPVDLIADIMVELTTINLQNKAMKSVILRIAKSVLKEENDDFNEVMHTVMDIAKSIAKDEVNKIAAKEAKKAVSKAASI